MRNDHWPRDEDEEKSTDTREPELDDFEEYNRNEAQDYWEEGGEG